MTRALSSAAVALVTSTVVRAVGLAEFLFDSGTIRLWTGYGDLVYDGNTYTGTGNLGAVTAAEETQELRAVNAQFELSGIDPAIIALVESEPMQDRRVLFYLGFVTEAAPNTLITTPYRLFTGRVDTADTEHTGETATVLITAENVLVTLERANERRFTDEDQGLLYPDDKGLEFVNSLQDTNLQWGT